MLQSEEVSEARTDKASMRRSSRYLRAWVIWIQRSCEKMSLGM